MIRYNLIPCANLLKTGILGILSLKVISTIIGKISRNNIQFQVKKSILSEQ